MDLKDLYQKRKEEFSTNAEALRSKYVKFSFIRLIVFLAAIAVFVAIWSASILMAIIFLVLFLLGFARFVFWHQDIQNLQFHNEFLSQINADEGEVVQHKYQMYADGSEFSDPLHPNAIDLDLFGPYSFFQYANRTSTSIGKKRLAEYLSKVEDSEEILARQQSVNELKLNLDWRQNLQAFGLSTKDDPKHIALLERWLREETYVMDNKLLVAAINLSPLWFITGTVLWTLYLPWYLGILYLVVPAWILRKYVMRINKTHMYTTHAEKILGHYGKLIAHIEQESFETPKLQHLSSTFTHDGQKASKSIKRLSYIIGQLNVRYNIFSFILQISGLWDLQWVWRLEKWKTEQRQHLPLWFDSLAEIEALSSYATVAYNNPKWVMPAITTEDQISAKELGHPLIDREKRVANDFSSPTKGHIKLVTGSNMAGKSTFLRTVGLNAVLATSGSVVCAESLSMPLLQIHTSMRTVDALHESTSSFYAELKRLKTIIEAVETESNIYFLLDEILKGTNSNDRHTGSKVLIQQMIKSQGGGIIATHDLELGAMEAHSNGAIENLCMEVEVDNDELHFDYKLKKGVSQSFNATLLMKNMGIRIDE